MFYQLQYSQLLNNHYWHKFLHIINANTNLEFRLHDWTLEGVSLNPDFLMFISLIVDMIDNNYTLSVYYLL